MSVPALSVMPHGTAPGGALARLYVLERGPLRAVVSSFGATLVSLEAPDRTGRRANVLLGLTSLADYVATDAHFGAIVGRYANRIAGGCFTLDGQVLDLARNEGRNTLHGGPNGFDKAVWAVTDAAPHRVALRHVSPDGDNGFPGRLTLDVAYALDAAGGLSIAYAATTDRATVLNPTNHAYFNLAGEGTGDILDHEVSIAAQAYLPTDADQIPTGARASVAGTLFDFRQAAALRPRIRDTDAQLRIARGFDHAYVLGTGAGLRPAATARDPVGGRQLTVLTDRPCLQFYTGNSLDGSAAGPGGRTYRQSDGLCFEAQGFPDAPNHADFPSTVLRPGERFETTTVYALSTD